LPRPPLGEQSSDDVDAGTATVTLLKSDTGSHAIAASGDTRAKTKAGVDSGLTRDVLVATSATGGVAAPADHGERRPVRAKGDWCRRPCGCPSRGEAGLCDDGRASPRRRAECWM
jgi:hypothetical protein